MVEGDFERRASHRQRPEIACLDERQPERAVRCRRLITPPVHAGVLESIRLEHAAQLLPDHTVEHREIPRTELHFADEVYTCGTPAEVQPVLAIDDLPIGDGTGG